jgi:hypothetical protein
MKFLSLVSLLSMFLFSSLSFSQDLIKGWKKGAYDLTEKQVVDLVSSQLWYGFGFEDEGTSCGGNFNSFSLVSSLKDAFILSFTADRVVDYCRTTEVVNAIVVVEKTNLGWEATQTFEVAK